MIQGDTGSAADLAGEGAGVRRRRGLGARALLRRVGASVLVLFVLSVGIFLLIHAAPGSPESALTAGRPVTPETLQTLRERYRLDDPLPVQYAAWFWRAVQLDFGDSLRSNESVTDLIRARGIISLQLTALAAIMALAVALPLAVLAASRRRRPTDRLISVLAALGVAAPPFALAVLLLYFFGVQLAWFPVFGPGEGMLDRLWHLVLPAVALAVGVFALVLKITRAALIGALEQEYVVFARARGLSRTRVMLVYAMRNSLAAIATAAGLTIATLVASTVLVEETFAIPGAGSQLVEAVRNQDVPVVQGLSLAVAAFILLINLLTDIVYALVDPRIDLSRSLE